MLERIILWKCIDEHGNIHSKGFQFHACNIDQKYLKKHKLTLVEKEYEIDYEEFGIFPVVRCMRHDVETYRLSDMHICGKCLEESISNLPESWQKEKKREMLIGALKEAREKNARK